jgi:hypothetical protein
MAGGALVTALLIAPPLQAAPSGGVLGWVEDSHGMPVPGALISLFGRGAGGSGLVTLSDSAGRFFLPSLPAGSYTLRALRSGHVPAPARQIVVLPNQDAMLSVSLTPLADAAARQGEARSLAAAAEEAERETKWLLRHKRRSVLEARADGPAVAQSASAAPADADIFSSFLAELGGSVEVMASPSDFGMGTESIHDPGSLGLLRLKGRLAESGRWSVGGILAERENTTWRMAAEFVLEPFEGHEMRASTGYGSSYLGAQSLAGGEMLHGRGVGAVAFEDRWTMADTVTMSVGGRFSYVGFMEEANHFDPSATLELRDEGTTIRGTIHARTIAPGGDILTLSSLASAPAMNFAVLDGGVRAERLARYELALDQQLGGTSLGAFTYYEGVHDQLVNVFEGAIDARALRIFNGGHVNARGMGLSVARCFGDVVRGSMVYTYGRTRREAPQADNYGAIPALAHPEGNFHDLAARVETVIDGTDTRVVAFYRVNRLRRVVAGEPGDAPLLNRRFDVQLSQGLPFLGALTRADWDFLLAVRNIFYETSEGALLDEVAVTNPPKRVLGGISVRF